jgi:hypothetical protein
MHSALGAAYKLPAEIRLLRDALPGTSMVSPINAVGGGSLLRSSPRYPAALSQFQDALLDEAFRKFVSESCRRLQRPPQ